MSIDILMKEGEKILRMIDTQLPESPLRSSFPYIEIQYRSWTKSVIEHLLAPGVIRFDYAAAGIDFADLRSVELFKQIDELEGEVTIDSIDEEKIERLRVVIRERLVEQITILKNVAAGRAKENNNITK